MLFIVAVMNHTQEKIKYRLQGKLHDTLFWPLGLLVLVCRERYQCNAIYSVLPVYLLKRAYLGCENRFAYMSSCS